VSNPSTTIENNNANTKTLSEQLGRLQNAGKKWELFDA
jgi:hypothetical protein